MEIWKNVALVYIHTRLGQNSITPSFTAVYSKGSFTIQVLIDLETGGFLHHSS